MISVITWDAGFREFHHTADFFANQEFAHDDYEFIWVDFYSSNERLLNKLKQYTNTKVITLNNSYKIPWHMGKCINKGVSVASGDLLVIVDGDIAVEQDFLSYVWASHVGHDNLALYFKRYDEPQKASCKESHISIDHLRANTELTNPTNFAGCLSIKRENFELVNGFENHDVFSGAGGNGLEMNIRLRNAGMEVKWASDKKIFHPWHPSSGSTEKEEKRKALGLVRQKFDWIIPYSGLEQSWIIYRRSIKGDVLAGENECNSYLASIPQIDLEFYIDIVNRLCKEGLVKYFKKIEKKLCAYMNYNNSQDSNVSYSSPEDYNSPIIEEVRLWLLEIENNNQNLRKELKNCSSKLRQIQESKYWRIGSFCRKALKNILEI